MKNKLLLSIAIILTLFSSNIIFAQAPSIVTQPSDQIVCEGTLASFSVDATGTALTYQWRQGIVNLVDGGNISGSNTATLTINPASVMDASSDYNVIVSGSMGPNDTSNYAILDVNTSPNIIIQPGNQTICAGDTARFSVIANGLNLNYQWKKGTMDLMTGGNILDATSPILEIYPTTIADTSSFYYVVITGGCAPPDSSGNVSLLINTPPTITTQPTNQTVCMGNPASFSVVASGTGITYQWRKGNVNLSNGLTISGVNTPTLSINPVTALDTASNYNVVISGGCPPNDTSINVSLKIDSTNIITQPSNQTVCSGSSVSFTAATSGTVLIYQWRKGNVPLVNGGNISGVNTATLTINPATISDTSSFYNVVIVGACPPVDTSINVSLMINTAPNITSQPINQMVCSGSTAIFSVGATGSGLTYQWTKNGANLTNGGNISGSNTATLTINPATISDTSSFYNVIITGGCAPNATSTSVSLMLNAAPSITSQPTNQMVCSGNAVSFSVGASGTGLTYQWMNGSTTLVDGGNISGSNTATLTINPTNTSDTSSFYHVVVTGGCAPNATSINVSLMLNMAPSITTQPNNQTACSGGLVSFVVMANGSGLTYQWTKGGANLINGGNISGANTATLTINPATISDTSSFYNVIISGGCSTSTTSIDVSFKLNTAPNITNQPSNQTVCSGNAANFSVTASGTGLTYQWRKGNANLANGGNISGANTAILTINPATISDTSSFYNVVIIGACSPNDTSIKVFLHINALPTVTANASTTTVCAGSSVIFNGGGATTYTWTNGVQNGVAYIPSATNTYTVTGTDGNACTNTAAITITVNNLPAIAPTSNSPVCIGSTINLSTSTVNGATYNWTGPNSFTSSIQNPTIASAVAANGGTYSLSVTSNGCSSDSAINVVVYNCAGTDLSVVKTVDNTHPMVGNNVVFTLTVSNKGPNNVTGVIVGDTLQNGFTYVSSSATKGGYNASTGIWTIDSLNSGVTAVLMITAKVNASGTYINTTNIHGNGPDTNMVNNISSVQVFPTELFIPEGFSPNGDGVNDMFVVRAIENYPHNTFTIFNRWGDKVYGASPYQSTWDGKATTGLRVGGDDLPVGTYFYTLDLGDGSKVLKGSIYLNK
jgi:gliding motility-associated-like protein/uncharacterized repeat protein (TIGR01451 family)